MKAIHTHRLHASLLLNLNATTVSIIVVTENNPFPTFALIMTKENIDLAHELNSLYVLLRMHTHVAKISI